MSIVTWPARRPGSPVACVVRVAARTPRRSAGGRARASRTRPARRTPRTPRTPWRRLSTHTTRADIMIWRQSTGRKARHVTTGPLSTSVLRHTTIPDQMIDSKLALTELDDDLLKY
ncbi:unnamed protein product [Euphydryas editha]|uniref:Uncharacterized protein n=1 Tax=Euphydryas editha TaxID=104508 RepID=A0AAU9V377_EUPED|nr:unnamed protein product [Euphydryas editha]